MYRSPPLQFFRLMKSLVQIATILIICYTSQVTSEETSTAPNGTINIVAYFDYKTGISIYKVPNIPACYIGQNKISNDHENIHIPQFSLIYFDEDQIDKEKFKNLNFLRTFCDTSPLFKFTILKQHTVERRKRQRQTLPVPISKTEGGSQLQLQGQIHGTGFFSGQASSKLGHYSQSQIQMMGAGLTGSFSSVADAVRTQLSMGQREASGQATTSGFGPSNTHLQFRIGGENETNMGLANAYSKYHGTAFQNFEQQPQNFLSDVNQNIGSSNGIHHNRGSQNYGYNLQSSILANENQHSSPGWSIQKNPDYFANSPNFGLSSQNYDNNRPYAPIMSNYEQGTGTPKPNNHFQQSQPFTTANLQRQNANNNLNHGKPLATSNLQPHGANNNNVYQKQPFSTTNLQPNGAGSTSSHLQPYQHSQSELNSKTGKQIYSPITGSSLRHHQIKQNQIQTPNSNYDFRGVVHSKVPEAHASSYGFGSQAQTQTGYGTQAQTQTEYGRPAQTYNIEHGSQTQQYRNNYNTQTQTNFGVQVTPRPQSYEWNYSHLHNQNNRAHFQQPSLTNDNNFLVGSSSNALGLGKTQSSNVPTIKPSQQYDTRIAENHRRNEVNNRRLENDRNTVYGQQKVTNHNNMYAYPYNGQTNGTRYENQTPFLYTTRAPRYYEGIGGQIPKPVQTTQSSFTHYNNRISTANQNQLLPNGSRQESKSTIISDLNSQATSTGNSGCKVVAFRCTIVLQSNRRAKLCKPMANSGNDSVFAGHEFSLCCC